MNARRFSKVMRKMSKVPSRISAQVARDISDEMQMNFDRGVDPYGRKWRKLAKSTLARGRHPPPLTDTGKGRASIVVVPTSGAGIKITVAILYMIYHQFGAPKLPKRSYIPTDRMPSKWLKIWQKRLDQEARGRLG